MQLLPRDLVQGKPFVLPQHHAPHAKASRVAHLQLVQTLFHVRCGQPSLDNLTAEFLENVSAIHLRAISSSSSFMLEGTDVVAPSAPASSGKLLAVHGVANLNSRLHCWCWLCTNAPCLMQENLNVTVANVLPVFVLHGPLRLCKA